MCGDPGENDDVPVFLFAHVRQDGLDNVDGAIEVGLELVAHEGERVVGLRELFDGADEGEGLAD